MDRAFYDVWFLFKLVVSALLFAPFVWEFVFKRSKPIAQYCKQRLMDRKTKKVIIEENNDIDEVD
jgi:hypothetical protein